MTTDERRKILSTYMNAYDNVCAAIRDLPADALQFKPAPNRWSIDEILIHLADSEANAYVRCRTCVAEPGSPIAMYDQDKWTSRMQYAQQNTRDALALFRLMRTMTADMLRMQPESVWAHTYEHPERGTLTLDDWLITYADHITGHINQIKQNLAAWNNRNK